MARLDEFARIFQLPPAMLPYIDFVVTEQEMELILGLNDQAMTIEQIAEMMGMSLEEAEEFVTKAYHRSVIVKAGVAHGHHEEGSETYNGPTTYEAGTFYRRLDPLAMYEKWGDVPAEARDAVIEWQLQEFIDIWQPAIEQIRKDPDALVRIPNRDFLLLEEALEQVEAATDHVVVPCDCRSIVKACNRPVDVCIRLDKGALMTLEHGQGRRVTREEMKAIVIDAHRAGLMHTGARDWRKDGQLFGFCNCCACDCYPIRASMKIGLGKAWPRSHYIAERDLDKCIHCGLCITQCHFGAWHRDGSTIEINGKTRKAVQFDTEKCQGCGLCATACPEAAITMMPLCETWEEDTV